MKRTLSLVSVLLYTLALALASVSVGCAHPEPVPPPVSDGRCLVAHWTGSSAIDQTCVLGGYSWRCLRMGAMPNGTIGCDRGPEVAEVPHAAGVVR